MRKAVVIVLRFEQSYILCGHLPNIRNQVLLVVPTLVILPIEIYLVPAFLSKRYCKEVVPSIGISKSSLKQRYREQDK